MALASQQLRPENNPDRSTPTPMAGYQTPQSTGQQDLILMRRWFRAYEANKSREITEQRLHRRYYHTKQWTDKEIAKLTRRGQPIITANRVKRKIDFLVGVEQRMRRDPKAYPRNSPQDEAQADVATAAVRFATDLNEWEQLASQVAHEGFSTGFGVIFCGIESRKNGNEPVLKLVNPDRFFYDPRSEKSDFSDARYMGVSIWMDIDEAREQWPDQADKLNVYLDHGGGLSTFVSEEDHEVQWGDFTQRRVRVVEMWYKGMTGEGPSGVPQPTQVRPIAWRFVKFCGDVILEDGLSPYLDEEGNPDNPYIGWTCYIDEQGDRYSIIRDLKPIQDEVNHRRSKLLHTLNSKQVYTRDESVVDDMDNFRNELSKPDGVIVTRGTWGVDVGLVDQSQQIQGQAELLTEAKSEIENLGPNPGLIGQGGGIADQSGRAILAQRDSGMTELSPVFDRLRGWKLRVYRKLWLRLKQAWTGQKWIRVTNNPLAPGFVGLNQYTQDPMTGQIQGQNVLTEIDVDIIMEEGPDSIVMNEELMQQLASMGEAAMGPMGRVMIELSNVPRKDYLLQLIQQAQPPPDPVQEQAKQLKVAGMGAEVQHIQSKTALNMSRAHAAVNPQPKPLPPPPPPEAPPDPVTTALEQQSIAANNNHLNAKAAELYSQVGVNQANALKAATEARIMPQQTPGGK